VFHVRGEHGATGISTNGKIELLQAKNEELGGSMVYPYWHPGGRYCAFSTNKTSQMFHSKLNKRIEVFDTGSDVFVYDTKNHTILRDTLIMKKYWAENTPAFSPDGKWLYFTTAKRQVFPDNYNKEKYSLCRVAFDDKTGRLGQKVDTLINTNQTGKSVTWPRLSYDGKYLMYTQIDYGYFSIWHPEADLWMLDLKTMETRAITEANSKRCESFHNWSTNSRWFLFTSRRDDGLYTKVYFSHVDAHGKVSKPFLLPQRNPREYYRMLMYSYNTPDFVAAPIKANPRELGQAIEGDKRREFGIN
jgi:Tol biopolymer transport system component